MMEMMVLYLAVGAVIAMFAHWYTGMGALLELMLMVLLWPLCAAAALFITAVCMIVKAKERIRGWRK